MRGGKAKPLGRRSAANPLGSGDHDPVTAPLRGVGLQFPEREMDATERFETDESELEDDLDVTPWGPRHYHPLGGSDGDSPG